jgi:hypothetical protein
MYNPENASHHRQEQRLSAFQLPRRHDRNHTGPLAEPRPENAVGILKHAILQTDHDELAALEPRLDDAADVLRVREIQRRVHFVEDVHGRGFELQECQDQGEGDE